MTGILVYAVPWLKGTALAVPAESLEDVRGMGHVLGRYPVPMTMDVLVAAPHDRAVLDPAAVLVAQRLATAATLRAPQEPAVGPRGAWYATLIVSGWLLILAAAQSTADVLGGLWLAAGLPLARRAYRQRSDAAAAGAAVGLHGVMQPAAVRQLEHHGLTALASLFAAAGTDSAGTDAEVYWRAAAACPDAGLPWLAPMYHALAGGTSPTASGGVWAPLGAGDGPVPSVAAAAEGATVA